MKKLTLIDDWKKSYKLYTMWILSFIAVLPQIWNELTIAGVINSSALPKEFAAVITTLGVIGMTLRIVKQNVEKINQQVAQEIGASEPSTPTTDSATDTTK